MTETQRLRKELEKCRARNVAMFDVVEAARRIQWIDVDDLRYRLMAKRLEDALETHDKAIEKEGG